MTVRNYLPSDAAAVGAWWEARHGRTFPAAMLPPCGVVVEDNAGPVCALWLYMSVGIGVAFLENPVARPGLPPMRSMEAFDLALGALEITAKDHGYGVMVCHTMPPIARMLKKRGWKFSETPVITGEKYLNAATPP